MSDLTVQGDVQRLRLGENDRLIVTVRGHVSLDASRDLAKRLAQFLGIEDERRIGVVGDGTQFTIIDPSPSDTPRG